MSVRRLFVISTLFLFIVIASPSKASAEWLFTPFIGVNWGGSATVTEFGEDFEDEFKQRMNFGAGLTWMSDGPFGIEFDFGYSPNFFEETTDDFEFINDSNVTTLMANVVVAGRSGAIRPYGTGGIGLIRSRIGSADDFFDDAFSNLGFNVGGGVNAFFTDNVGIRGDIRYFRQIQDNEPDDEPDFVLGDLRFWRGTVGVVFSF